MAVEVEPRVTVIERRACGCCGGPVLVKINRNRCAYYFCPNVTADGEPCVFSARWSKTATARMIDAYVTAALAGQPAPDRTAKTKKGSDDGGSLYI